MTNKYKVGIYLRLSKEDERLGESSSITNQRAILLDYIEKNNIEKINVSQGYCKCSNGRVFE